MDFWNSYRDSFGSVFGEDRLFLGTSEHKNASLKSVSEFSRELGQNMAFVQKKDLLKRYILAANITHDLLVLAYDVDNSSVFAARITRLPEKKTLLKMQSMLKGMRSRNLEFRLIGLQNGGSESIRGIEEGWKGVKSKLVETDLFGANMRNVAMDTKTGMTYNLLMLNRIYRAGELANTISRADFDNNLGELSFV